jgi:hypothetical protein
MLDGVKARGACSGLAVSDCHDGNSKWESCMMVATVT